MELQPGALVAATIATTVGTETLIGRVKLLFVGEPIEAFVKGIIIATRIEGLPIPIEESKPAGRLVRAEHITVLEAAQ